MDTTRTEDVEKIRDLIKEIDFCMLTTVDEAGKLHSRPMSTNGQVEFDGDLWFFTSDKSHKVDEVEARPQVNVAFADPAHQNYVSLAGRAELVKDRAKIKALWQPHLKAWFPDGPDQSDVALLKVHVDHAEYWDSPSSTVAHVVGLAKSLLTGQPKDVGENKKVDLH